MIKLKKISFKNILSFGNQLTTLDFDTFNNAIISAKNGSGKSCIIEAIYYALYGKSYRGLKLDDLINNINKKALYTKIEFYNNEIQYVIERGISPNIFKVYKNGEALTLEVSKNEFQKRVNEIIGIDAKIFGQIAIADSLFYKPFMTLSAAERRYVTDHIFGLDVITKMQIKAKELKSKIETKIQEQSNEITLLEQEIELSKQFGEQKKKEDIDRLEYEITEAEQTIKTNDLIIGDKRIDKTKLEDKMNTIKSSIEKIETFVQDLQQKQNTLEIETKTIQSRIQVLMLGNCDKCASVFDSDKAQEEIKKYQIILKNNEIEIEQLISKQKSERSVIKTFTQDVNDKQQKINVMYGHISELQDNTIRMQKLIANKKQQILDIQNQKVQVNEESKVKLEETKKQNGKNKSMLVKIKESIQILSDDGIRSFILKNYLPSFNSTLAKYLDIMDAPFIFEFDSQFEQVVNEKLRGKQISYTGYSAGQKARVNFAILFSLIDFAEQKSGTRFDFLIVDELIDSANLDNDGKDAIIAILKNHIKKKILCISHNTEIQNNFEKTFTIDKRGNFSKLL